MLLPPQFSLVLDGGREICENFGKNVESTMLKKWVLMLVAAIGVTSGVYGEDKIGVVNFGTCITESKYGQREQGALDGVKKQMERLMTDIVAQLQDTQTKLQDTDYMDGLSPEGEQELKAKWQSLREEHDRYQAQFYQVDQQSRMQLLQKMSGYVNVATDAIAKAQGYSLIVSKDVCFSFTDSKDVTQLVVDEMDKAFDAAESEKK